MSEKFFGLLAAVCAAVQYVPYIYDTIKGRTRPQRVAWLIWFALGGVILFSQLAKGASESLWVTCVQMAGNLVIFLLAIKRGYGSFGKRDGISLALAGVGLALWAITKEPTVALLIAIAVDGIGAALVAIKAYHDPHGETLSTWVFSGFAGLCAALAVGSFQKSILLAYPVYVVLNSAITAVTIIVRKRIVEHPDQQRALAAELEAE